MSNSFYVPSRAVAIRHIRYRRVGFLGALFGVWRFSEQMDQIWQYRFLGGESQLIWQYNGDLDTKATDNQSILSIQRNRNFQTQKRRRVTFINKWCQSVLYYMCGVVLLGVWLRCTFFISICFDFNSSFNNTIAINYFGMNIIAKEIFPWIPYVHTTEHSLLKAKKAE